jgi:hypothetical protein
LISCLLVQMESQRQQKKMRMTMGVMMAF